MDFREVFKVLISLPKTIYFNFKCLPFDKARHLPILVDHRTCLGDLGKRIEIDFDAHLFYIRLGWGGTECRNFGVKSFVSVGKEGRLIFKGPCWMASGLSLTVDKGCLEIGKDFYCNCNCFISCNNTMTISDDNIWGWNVEVLDSDNHQITHSKSLGKNCGGGVSILANTYGLLPTAIFLRMPKSLAGV